MRNIILAILASLLTACGGAEFSADADAFGGDAGASDVTVGGGTVTVTGGSAGSVSAGGSSSTGGKPVGAAGAPQAGSGGTAPATCEFDPVKLTALLPKTIVWKDFLYTEGDLCVTCRDKPCVTIDVTSWGSPELYPPTGQYRYIPNIAMPVAPLSIGTNDGACTPQNTDCGIKVTISVVQFVPEWSGDHWDLSMLNVQGGGSGNACLADSKFSNSYAVLNDLQQEFAATLSGLKIPCD